MHTIKPLYVALILVLLPASTLIAKQLGLQEAIDLALQNSQALRITKEEVHLAELKTSEFSAQRLPRLDLNGQYVYTSEVMKMVQQPTSVDLGIQTVTIPGQEIAFGDEHSADIKLLLTQPLFTGFRLQKAHQAAKHEIHGKDAELGKVEWEIRHHAEEVYILAQKATEFVKTVANKVKILERHFEDAERRVQEGVAPAEVSARVELALRQAQSELQSAQRSERLAKTTLLEVIDLSIDASDLTLDDFPEMAVLGVVVDGLVDIALDQRAEIEMLKIQRGVLDFLVSVRQAAYYPSLYAFGALNYGRPGVDRLANEWMFYQTAGISFNWTLWDWNQRRNQTQQVQVSGRQLDESLTALESRIRLEVQAAEQALTDAIERYRIAGESLELSGKILDWVHQRHAQGTATETELLDAEDEYTQSEIQKVIALADYYLALNRLKSVCGTDNIQAENGS